MAMRLMAISSLALSLLLLSGCSITRVGLYPPSVSFSGKNWSGGVTMVKEEEGYYVEAEIKNKKGKMPNVTVTQTRPTQDTVLIQAWLKE